MKVKVLVLVALGALMTTMVEAQNRAIKIGYTHVDYILSQMPESKQLESELKAYEKQLSNQLQSKMDEFQTKLETYQSGASTMIPEVRADKEAELQSLQESIKKFQQEAQVSLQNKQVELFQPAYDKIQDAIDQVAEDNGYTHVFSSDASGLPILLYASEEDNISNLVLKQMGITPPEDGPDGGNMNLSPQQQQSPATTTPSFQK